MITAVIVCVNRSEHLARTIRHNLEQVDRIVVVTTRDDKSTVEVCRDCFGIEKFSGHLSYRWSDRCFENASSFNIGAMQNDGLKYVDSDWILFLAGDCFLNPNFKQWIKDNPLNPEYIYGVARYDGDDWEVTKGEPADPIANEPNGYFQLWHRSKFEKRWPKVMAENFPTVFGIDSWLLQQYPYEHRRLLPLPCLHIKHEIGCSTPDGHTWRWAGMVNFTGEWIPARTFNENSGFWEYFEPLPDGPLHVKLIDTLNADEIELQLMGSDIPRSVLRVKEGGGLIFKGKDIGFNHVHVVYMQPQLVEPFDYR